MSYLATVCLFALCQFIFSEEGGKLQKKWDLNGKHKSFAADMLIAHNEARKLETEANPPLKDLIWDPELSTMAQKWAEVCIYKHSLQPRVGENICARGVFQSGKPDLLDDKLARKEMLNCMNGPASQLGWYGEKEFYDRPNCQEGKVCTHYTQIVWADTKKVGCGIAQCKDLICDKKLGCFNALNVVCQYWPQGNILVNGVMKPPYRLITDNFTEPEGSSDSFIMMKF